MTDRELDRLDFDVELACDASTHATHHRPGDRAAYMLTTRACGKCERGQADTVGAICAYGLDLMRSYVQLTHPCGFTAPPAWWIARLIPIDDPWVVDTCRTCGATYAAIRGAEPMLRAMWLAYHRLGHRRATTTTEEIR